MSKKIGVIAEDNSDIEVIEEILKKHLNSNGFKVKKFVGNGCGKLRNKCDSWTKILIDSGCDCSSGCWISGAFNKPEYWRKRGIAKPFGISRSGQP